MKKIVCFTGHRNIPTQRYDVISKILEEVIVLLIQNGYYFFGVGGALGFDIISALTIIKLKKDYSFIKLILVLPCRNHFKYWSIEEKKTFFEIKNQADKIVYITDEYSNGCTLKRNRHLVDNSKICICYLERNFGGTSYTVNYAKKKGLFVINIFDLVKP